MSGRSSLPLAGVDNRAIGVLATDHLLAGGVGHMGIITGPLDWWEAGERMGGWRDALDRHQFVVDDNLIFEGDWNAKSGEQGLQQPIRRCPDLDAVFVSNNQIALGVLHAAHKLGRRIPEDLSIVGVDCIPESAHFWPPLTTVRQRLRDAGSRAVRQLDRRIRDDESSSPEQSVPQVVLLRPELTVRESSRPAAGS